MGLFSRHKPKINTRTNQKDSFSGWLKCQSCEEMIHDQELGKNLYCCPQCDHHYRLTSSDRIAQLVDPETFKELFGDIRPLDRLKFVDTESYKNRLHTAQKKLGLSDAVTVGTAQIKQQKVALGVMDFRFMGGSMGSVVGERLTRLIEYSCKKRLPLIIVSASGGARMQESVFSLMQMAKTSAALARLSEQGIPYFSVLTDPTSGGVTASFATLGDIILAEPNALICFAGPRVIEQTIKEKLPPKAQRSEFLLKHGMIDRIVKRHDLRDTLATLIHYLTNNEREFVKNKSKTRVSP